MTNVPEWVVMEVGRLHLNAIALQKEVERLRAEKEGAKKNTARTDTNDNPQHPTHA